MMSYFNFGEETRIKLRIISHGKKKEREIHSLLNKERQELARRYEKENRLLGLGSSLWSLILGLTFYYSGLSAWLADSALRSSLAGTFFLYVISFLSLLFFCTFPLNFYSSYIHEHKWNFSNQTVKSWLWEQAKSFFVSMIILIVLLGLLLSIMAKFAQYWWLIAGLSMALVSVLFATISPVLILPIFNKYDPIQNKELIDALEKILSRGGLRSSGFFKEDMSRQTKKENAFLAGLGKTRRVILGDNLMENMTIPEIESIIAHEVGHFKYRHIWKTIALGMIEELAVFYIIDLAMKALFPQFLTSVRSNLTLFPVFAILFGGVSGFIFDPFRKIISRHFEKQADFYALKNIEDKKAFTTALAGLADRNLSNAYPEWWVKILYYSHPPIGERLRLAEDL